MFSAGRWVSIFHTQQHGYRSPWARTTIETTIRSSIWVRQERIIFDTMEEKSSASL